MSILALTVALAQPSKDIGVFDRPAVVIRQIDADEYLITSRQTIDDVRVQDAWQYADWDTEPDPQHRRTWLKITTKKRPLRIAVETTLPKTKGLTRTHWVEVR